MRGWNNPLPIGLSTGNPASSGGRGSNGVEKSMAGCLAIAGSWLTRAGSVSPLHIYTTQLPGNNLITKFPPFSSSPSCFPHVAFRSSFPTHHPGQQLWRPHCHWGIYRWLRSPGKGSTTSTNASASRIFLSTHRAY